VTATVGNVTATYQLPLTYRHLPVPELAHALVGVLAEPESAPQWVYDGPYDPAFVRAWLTLVATGARALSDNGPAGGLATGAIQPGTAGEARTLDANRPTRVLSGEQSNTSVIVSSGDDDPTPVILKVFRVLQPGANPDVDVASVLTSAGCPNVPRLTGWINGEWTGADGKRAHGHLTSVSEFLPGSDDAWRLACIAVEQGRVFTEQARGIGAATAAVHEALARAMPTSAATGATVGELLDQLHGRLNWALQAAPKLAPYAEAARAAVNAVGELNRIPRLQRIHGDLHLGQVLHAGSRGWVLLDFEGEPLRPLADRNRPDLALRDIAGMLRSFDYAARHTIINSNNSDNNNTSDGTSDSTSDSNDGNARNNANARNNDYDTADYDADGTSGTSGTSEASARTEAWAEAWAGACAQAFLEAYTDACGHDPRDDTVLLRALELDKALYETVYETRNRPTWIRIPLDAVARLVSSCLPVTQAPCSPHAPARHAQARNPV
jgi:1,4-alpha-glucan branching enzyme